MSNNQLMMWMVIPVSLAVVLFGIHRCALWAEDRGWIFYENTKPGAYGAAFIHGASAFAPEVEHVVDEQQTEDRRADIAESATHSPKWMSCRVVSISTDSVRR